MRIHGLGSLHGRTFVLVGNRLKTLVTVYFQSYKSLFTICIIWKKNVICVAGIMNEIDKTALDSVIVGAI